MMRARLTPALPHKHSSNKASHTCLAENRPLYSARQGQHMNRSEHQFFNELKRKLWTAADKQRPAQDAAVYHPGTARADVGFGQTH